MTCYFIYDIPVYRTTSIRHERDSAQLAKSALTMSLNIDESVYRDLYEQILHDLPCYRYNEIVGYIRLHFLGTQIRGEYYCSFKYKSVRSKTKIYSFKSHKLASEVSIDDTDSDGVIYAAIIKYISACRKEIPRRHVDTDLFEKLGPHVRWAELYKHFHGQLKT